MKQHALKRKQMALDFFRVRLERARKLGDEQAARVYQKTIQRLEQELKQ